MWALNKPEAGYLVLGIIGAIVSVDLFSVRYSILFWDCGLGLIVGLVVGSVRFGSVRFGSVRFGSVRVESSRVESSRVESSRVELSRVDLAPLYCHFLTTCPSSSHYLLAIFSVTFPSRFNVIACVVFPSRVSVAFPWLFRLLFIFVYHQFFRHRFVTSPSFSRFFRRWLP